MRGPINMNSIALAIATVFTAAAPAAFAQYAQNDRYDSRYDTRSDSREYNRYESREYYESRNYNDSDKRRPETARVIESRPVYAGESREECFNNRTRRFEELRDRGYMLDRSNCRVANYGGAVAGYDVRYEYQGREYVTRMDRDPGPRLFINRDINSNGKPLDSMGRDLDPNHSGG